MGSIKLSNESTMDLERGIEYYHQAHSISMAMYIYNKYNMRPNFLNDTLQFSYKDGSLESADSARKLAAAYACLGTEDAESEYFLISVYKKEFIYLYILFLFFSFKFYSVSSESYLNECLLTYQTNFGDIHEKTIQVQDDLVKLMLRTDRKEVILLGHILFSLFFIR